MSLSVISLARRMRFGVVMGTWLGGSSNLDSSQVIFFVRDMRSETSITSSSDSGSFVCGRDDEEEVVGRCEGWTMGWWRDGRW